MAFPKTVPFILPVVFYVVFLSSQTCAHQRLLLPTTKEYYSFFEFEKLLEEDTEKRKNSQALMADLIEALMSSSYPTAVATDIGEQCKADSIEYVENVFRNRSIWALQSKFLSALLRFFDRTMFSDYPKPIFEYFATDLCTSYNCA